MGNPQQHIRRIILIHGAWHGAWCWEKFVPYLQAQNSELDISTPNLAGLSFAESISHLSQLIQSEDSPVILLGHSLGGMLISQLCHQHTTQIAGLIFLAAFIPNKQATLLDLAQQDKQINFEPALDFCEKTSTSRLKPQQVGHYLYNTCHLDDLNWAIPQLCAQDNTGFSTAVKWPKDKIADISKTYIVCEKDNAVSSLFQKKMAIDCACQLLTLPSCHSPFISMPDKLADLVHQAILETF